MRVEQPKLSLQEKLHKKKGSSKLDQLKRINSDRVDLPSQMPATMVQNDPPQRQKANLKAYGK